MPGRSAGTSHASSVVRWRSEPAVRPRAAPATAAASGVRNAGSNDQRVPTPGPSGRSPAKKSDVGRAASGGAADPAPASPATT